MSWTWWFTLVTMGVVTVALIGWDIYVATNTLEGDTISEIMLLFAQKRMIVPMFFGVLMGHWFWPRAYRLVPWQWTIGVLCGVTLLVVGWDIIDHHWNSRVYDFLVKWPILIVTAGTFIGHFFWSQTGSL